MTNQISPLEYANRRQKLLSTLPDLGLVILDTKAEFEMTHENPYRYRPKTNFYYYTGVTEPESVAFMLNGSPFSLDCDNPFGPDPWKFGLLLRPRNPAKEIWTGQRIGPDRAKAIYGAEMAYSSDSTGIEQLKKLILYLQNRCGPKGTYQIYYLSDNPRSLVSQMIHELKICGVLKLGFNLQCDSIYSIISNLRLKKSPTEITQLREVISLSARAHVETMKETIPGLMEYQLDALLTFHFMHGGCPRLAYPSVVAGGNNANTLHYGENTDILHDGDLVLVDAGGEKNMMAADITRTWPVNGQFTLPQRQIYQLVLDAQQATLAKVHPGVTFEHLHQIAQRIIQQGLRKLGINCEVDSETDRLPYFPHYIGHWLGMEVHDCGGVHKNARYTLQFQPGFVITIEPGIYLPRDDPNIPAEYAGIGVRIEDDVLVTERGCEVLSSGAPKEIDEIEMLVGSNHFVETEGEEDDNEGNNEADNEAYDNGDEYEETEMAGTKRRKLK